MCKDCKVFIGTSCIGGLGGRVSEFWTSGNYYSLCTVSILNSIWTTSGLSEFKRKTNKQTNKQSNKQNIPIISC